MNEEQILSHYIDDKLSTYEIAEKVGTYPNKIRRILIKHGIETRGKSDAQKEALASGRSQHPTKGTKKTDEQKVHLSKVMAKRWDETSERYRKKFAENAKKRWDSLSEVDKADMRKKAADALRVSSKEGSKAEKYLYEELLKSGYDAIMHKKGLIEGENFEIDLFLPDLNVIIEIDGPQHFTPMFGETHLRNYVKYDSIKNGLLIGKGYCIIRIKYLCKHFSGRIGRTLWGLVAPELDKVEKSFPPKSKRLIELEIS